MKHAFRAAVAALLSLCALSGAAVAQEPPAPAEPVERYFILLFDSPLGGVRQLDEVSVAVEEWLAHELLPADAAAVVSYYGQELLVAQDFTRDRQALTEAVGAAVRGQAHASAPAEAGCPSLLARLPMDQDLPRQAASFYGALQVLAETVDSVPGPKGLLVFSKGFGRPRLSGGFAFSRERDARREPGPGEVPAGAEPLRADPGGPAEPSDPPLSRGPGDGLQRDLPARRRDEPAGGGDRRPLCLSGDRAAAPPRADRPDRYAGRGSSRPSPRLLLPRPPAGCKPNRLPRQPPPQPPVRLPAGEEIPEHPTDAGYDARHRHHPLPDRLFEEHGAGAARPAELASELGVQPLRIPFGLAGEQVLRRPGPGEQAVADPFPGQRIGHGRRIPGEQDAPGEP